MMVYVAMAKHYDSYGENVEMVGVFSTYKKALDYLCKKALDDLRECHHSDTYEVWVEEEEIQ